MSSTFFFTCKHILTLATSSVSNPEPNTPLANFVLKEKQKSRVFDLKVDARK